MTAAGKLVIDQFQTLFIIRTLVTFLCVVVTATRIREPDCFSALFVIVTEAAFLGTTMQVAIHQLFAILRANDILRLLVAGLVDRVAAFLQFAIDRGFAFQLGLVLVTLPPHGMAARLECL